MQFINSPSLYQCSFLFYDKHESTSSMLRIASRGEEPLGAHAPLRACLFGVRLPTTIWSALCSHGDLPMITMENGASTRSSLPQTAAYLHDNPFQHIMTRHPGDMLCFMLLFRLKSSGRHPSSLLNEAQTRPGPPPKAPTDEG